MSVADSIALSGDGHRPPLRKIVLGTRGSDLALAQTALAQKAIQAAHPVLKIETRIIATSGDKGGASFQLANPHGAQVENLRHGRKGMFTAEIERALVAGEIDVAVHSAKDLPSELSSGTQIAAVLARVHANDVLVTMRAGGLAALPRAARVGTSSVRRQHQLRRRRPDLRVADLRGNVPTRLRKLRAGDDWDAVILACAGLERLGFDVEQPQFECEGAMFHTQILDFDEFLPAGGQGIIALQLRANEESAKQMLSAVNHIETFICLRAEREFLRLLQGDCGSPVGVLASCEGKSMSLRAEVFETDGGGRRAGLVKGFSTEPEQLARDLMEQLYGG